MSNLLSTLLSKKGQFVSAIIEKKVKQLKGSPYAEVTKKTCLVARAGVAYDNITAVKEKRESGELPAENQGLTWGQWVDGGFPYLIHHKGEHYARLSLIPNNAPKVTYTIAGKEVTKQEALQYALASEKGGGEAPDVITVNLKNIKELK